MRYLIPLLLLFLLYSTEGHTQTSTPPQKWTLHHKITKEKKTFKAKHWMQISWRENDTTRTMKAKLYRLDADSVTIKNKYAMVDIARKDVIKVKVIRSIWSRVSANIGSFFLTLGIGLGLSGFMGFNVTSSLGGSLSNIRVFENMALIGLVAIVVGIGFLIAGRFDSSTQKEPFSAQWILKSKTIPSNSNKPEQFKKNAQPGNQLP